MQGTNFGIFKELGMTWFRDFGSWNAIFNVDNGEYCNYLNKTILEADIKKNICKL